MRTPAVELTDIFGQDLLQMALIEDEHVVQSLGGEGRPLPPRLAQEITREIERLGLVQQEIAAIEHERDESPTTCKETEKKRAQLLLLKGIGATGSAVMPSCRRCSML